MQKRKFIFPLIAVLLISLTIPIVHSSLWVYPTPTVYPDYISSPTVEPSPHWYIPLTEGSQTLSLVVWNQCNNRDLEDTRFVIAVTSGLSQLTIVSVKDATPTPASPLTLEAEDLTGATTPGQFPPGDIFPCPWKQYSVGTLSQRQSASGWQGSGDLSGRKIEVTITVTGNPDDVNMYFLAFGYKTEGNGNLYVDTPYSHITETISPPDNNVPEVPIGPVAASISMLSAFGAFCVVRKRKANL